MPNEWPDLLTVAPISQARGEVRLPGSKSISNRALLLAALSRGETALAGLLDAEDTRVMIEALRTLGIRIDQATEVTRVLGGAGAFPVKQAELFLGNAGTAMRPLTAALAFAGGTYRLDGAPRMRERPIGDLVEALNALGACIAFEGVGGFPPLLISPAGSLTIDHVDIRGDVSSQFASGLLMAAPLIALPAGLKIRVPGNLISQPYVAMTVAMMAQFGVSVQREGATFLVPQGRYAAPGQYAVEGDASGASYFLALGAIAGGPVRVRGVGRDSIQGDVAFADLLQEMGAQIDWGKDFIDAREGSALVGIDHDCTEIPDAAMTAAVVALFARGKTVLRGIGSWRVKETDRISAMATELRKVGARVEEGADRIAIDAPPTIREATIETYDDHRIAMCFSLAAAAGVPIHIRDPRCVAKTFPDYFERLAQLVRRSTV